MHRPLPIHEQLISLRRLCLDGRALEFTQAFLSVNVKDNVPKWSGTLRGVSLEEVSRLRGELELHAQAIDGRTIEGRVMVPDPSVEGEMSAVLELAGLESLLIDGRQL
jgi:hypothetical protein